MLLLPSLFVFLGVVTAQPVANVPVQVTEHVSSTRYQFKYQENEHIIDLNAKRKILAYYIKNELQNPSLLPSTQKELLRYHEKSKLDLLETFDYSSKRTQRVKRRGREWGRRSRTRSETRGRTFCSAGRCGPTRRGTRIGRKNKPSTSIKINLKNLKHTGGRLMAVGTEFMITGFPPVVAAGKVLIVLGFLTWVYGELSD